jgi:hypothetical protein
MFRSWRTQFRARDLAGLLLVCASIIYLVPFVTKGWVPHDEGALGQSAEWVLTGGRPHVDYQELFTGGLSWLHSVVFKVAGIDLAHLRWLLFAAAAIAQFSLYAIARRFVRPVGAAMVAWVGLVWGFPNYFAAVPNWWILVCALVMIWALLRHLETGSTRWLIAAGLAVGIAIIMKQTGVYLLIALILSIVFGTDGSGRHLVSFGQAQLVRVGIAAATIGFALVITRHGLGSGELVYLVLPIAAVGLAFACSMDVSITHAQLRSALTAIAAAALPIALFLMPYLFSARLEDFVKGAIVLPQKRLQFASVAMPPAWASIIPAMFVAAVALVPLPPALARRHTLVSSVRWGLAAVMVLLSIRALMAYQFVWQVARTMAAMLPIAALWVFRSEAASALQKRRLFVLASTLAWASLVQFPYGTWIYFCFVAPIAVIACVAFADTRSWLDRVWMPPVVAVLLLFPIAAIHPAFLWSVPTWSAPQALDVSLDLPRAHLTVSERDARTYQRVVSIVETHLGAGTLMAGPDCPEVYFLAKRRSVASYEFFSNGGTTAGNQAEIEKWTAADVVVVNHRPGFTPSLSTSVVAAVRNQFPHSETVGKFEVRWR